MSSDNRPFEVCVVGGAGHVGAPLAIVLASKGIRTLAYDVNKTTVAAFARGDLPFIELGGESLLAHALGSGMLRFTSDVREVARIPILVVTIGTPIDEFHNPRVDVVQGCLDDLMPYLSDEQTLILRSTVSPGVTDFVERYLRDRGKKSGIAFCPERVVQGQAIEELQTLPQIVSGTTQAAEDVAAELFSRIAPAIVRMVVKEAEFAKLISNAYRYIQFAAANQFYMMVEAAGLDYARMLRGLKAEYPRLRDLPGPGFSAGPCLMKDTMQLAAFNNNSFLLGNSAMMINEGLPHFIVERLRARRDIKGCVVGILGMAFKADVDDIRESLSYKLVKILQFSGATVRCSDEYVPDAGFIPAQEILTTSDVVIVGVPHRAYRSLRIPAGLDVIDLWGVLSRGD